MHAEPVTKSGLVRGIRRWDLVAFAVNCIIGAGIFGLPANIYALAGTYSLLGFLACAVVVTLIIVCFAEVGSRFSITGGPYLYAREAFGSVTAFQIGWLMWLARLTAFAAICNLLVSYVSFFIPVVAMGTWRTVVIIAVVLGLTTINLIGVRQSAVANNLFTIGKLTPLLLFILVGLFFLDSSRFTVEAAPSFGNFSTAVLQLVFAFSGFEMVVIPAGEVRDPRRNVAFAMLAAIGIVAVVYILVQVVCIGTLPELATSSRPLADASARFFGPAGASIISAGALVSVTGTLNAIMLAGPRLPFAMAEHGQIPKIFARTHKRFHTPYVAILVSAAVALTMTLTGTFVYALTISVVIRLITYAVTCLSLPVLRRRESEHPAHFKAPGGTVVSILAVLMCVWLISSSSWREAGDVGIALALGMILFLAYLPFRRNAARRAPVPHP